MDDLLATEATSPRTAAARLAELAAHPDEAVGRLVAANPAVPLAVASTLCAGFPDEFVANPSFTLWCLHDPLLLAHLPEPAACSLVGARSLTGLLLRGLALHPVVSVRVLVIRSPLATGEVIEQATRPWPQARSQAARLANALDALASSPQTPVPVLEKLLELPANRALLAANPAAPDYLRRALLEDATPGVVMIFARLPPAARRRVLRDPPPGVRTALASDPATPPWILSRLASDPSPEVRAAVARNIHTPEATRHGLRCEAGLVGRVARRFDRDRAHDLTNSLTTS